MFGPLFHDSISQQRVKVDLRLVVRDRGRDAREIVDVVLRLVALDGLKRIDGPEGREQHGRVGVGRHLPQVARELRVACRRLASRRLA